jgi:hypothetical protein
MDGIQKSFGEIIQIPENNDLEETYRLYKLKYIRNKLMTYIVLTNTKTISRANKLV